MKQIIENLLLGIAAAATLACLPVLALSQGPRPGPISRPEIAGRATAPEPWFPIWGGETSERSIKVDSSVNLSLCVTQGTVKVNGWNRSEVRVYIKDGSKFGFNVREKNQKTGEPNWISVLGVQAKNKYAKPTECIWGNEIEIDVPVNAVVSIEGQEATTNIDSVKKVKVNIIGGSISLRNISTGIWAKTGQGGVTVETSTGPMMLETTNGNIVAFEVGPGEIGDTFQAKTTGGNISLEDMQHRQVEVRSVSGSIMYNGSIRNGGSYNLSTSSGHIALRLLADTACRVSATFSSGMFNNELPLKLETENISEGPIKSIVGKLGKGGDATLRLTTYKGIISLKKQ